MREIKFRAWNKQKQIMCYDNEDETVDYWDGICTSKLEMVNMILSIPDKDDAYSINSFRNHYEVMQFTNLIDKNGTEIYEGDYVKCKWGHSDWSGIVEFIEGSFCSNPENPEKYPSALSECNDVEVIGNIYEHPHLLRGDSP